MSYATFHVNLPDRLVDELKDHEYAYFIGRTPAGVEWVAYQPDNVEPMQRAFSKLIQNWLQPRINEKRRRLERKEMLWPV